jgi:hemolysin type calcium-binding protein
LVKPGSTIASCALAAVALLAAAPAPASAGTASVVLRFSGHMQQDALLSYTGAPGERNDVTVTQPERYSFVFHDAGAVVGVNPGCEQLDEHTARCEAPSYTSFATVVRAGDRDDHVTNVDADVSIQGEAGDDTLFAGRGGYLDGGKGSDKLFGGPGPEELVGGPGRDELYGREGEDKLAGDGPGAKPAKDAIDGGAGVDTVSYAERSASVGVDLRRRGGHGARGEGDTIAHVEGVQGGLGADILTGDDGPNRLFGTPPGVYRARGDRIRGLGGDDLLTGGPGDDLVEGGPGADGVAAAGGRDRLRGGPGDDVLGSAYSEAGFRSDAPRPGDARCGSGSDTVDLPAPWLVIPRDCERTLLDSVAAATSGWRVRGGVFEVALSPAQRSFWVPPDCSAGVVLRSGGKRIGWTRVAFASGSSTTLARVQLSDAGLQLLARPGRVPVRVGIRGRPCGGPPPAADGPVGQFTLLL